MIFDIGLLFSRPVYTLVMNCDKMI